MVGKLKLIFHLLIAGIFGEIVYSLVGEQSKYFSIEPDTGIIMVANSSFLDRERQSEVSLSAVASDKAPITTRKSTAVPASLTRTKRFD